MLLEFNIQGVATFGTSIPVETHVEKNYSTWLPQNLQTASLIRKNEYIAGRYCAFEAAKLVGVELVSLPTAPSREPLWPDGIKGSITHSRKLALSCVVLNEAISSIGIDAEERLDLNLSQEFQETIASASELQYLSELHDFNGMTVLFSAKESLYKALYPHCRSFIEFKEVELTYLDPKSMSFELQLSTSNPKLTHLCGKYEGSYQVLGETIVTMVAVGERRC